MSENLVEYFIKDGNRWLQIWQILFQNFFFSAFEVYFIWIKTSDRLYT